MKQPPKFEWPLFTGPLDEHLRVTFELNGQSHTFRPGADYCVWALRSPDTGAIDEDTIVCLPPETTVHHLRIVNAAYQAGRRYVRTHEMTQEGVLIPGGGWLDKAFMALVGAALLAGVVFVWAVLASMALGGLFCK
jgi:hypothetical protein